MLEHLLIEILKSNKDDSDIVRSVSIKSVKQNEFSHYLRQVMTIGILILITIIPDKSDYLLISQLIIDSITCKD